MSESVVLCVDDDATLLQALRSLLSAQLGVGHWVEIAESAEEALDISSELREQGRALAVVISDYIMPGMRGDELLARLHRVAPASVKIMLSGQSDPVGVQRALDEAELYRFIEKPFVSQDLVDGTRAAIRTYWGRPAQGSGGGCSAAELLRLLEDAQRSEDPRPSCVTLMDLGEPGAAEQGLAEAWLQKLQRHRRRTDYFGPWGAQAYLLVHADTELADARAHAEALRQCAAYSASRANQALAGLTRLGVGVAGVRQGEPVRQAIERAAQALEANRSLGCLRPGALD